MTAIQYVKWLLDTNWTEERSGREVDVPKPDIYLQQNQGKVNLANKDAIVVEDGGTADYEPASFSWREEHETVRVTAVIRGTSRSVAGTDIDGRTRVFGHRNTGSDTDQYGLDPGESDTDGGLVGETKRILNDVRTGDVEYDTIAVPTVNDTSAAEGANRYRADVEIELRNLTRSL